MVAKKSAKVSPSSAVFCSKTARDLVKLLYRYGAPLIDLQNKVGDVPLLLACALH